MTHADILESVGIPFQHFIQGPVIPWNDGLLDHLCTGLDDFEIQSIEESIAQIDPTEEVFLWDDKRDLPSRVLYASSGRVFFILLRGTG